MYSIIARKMHFDFQKHSEPLIHCPHVNNKIYQHEASASHKHKKETVSLTHLLVTLVKPPPKTSVNPEEK